ncbi:MAG: tetratricopeptide repeat protein [Planctomycetota bacterium]
MRRIRGTTAALLMSCLMVMTGTARADELAWDTVVLKSGQELRGSVSRQGDVLVVRQRYGSTEVPVDQVKAVIERHDPLDERTMLEAQGFAHGTLEQRLRYAAFLNQQGLPREAKEAYLEVLRLDPDHAAARAALGYVRLDGRWLTFEQSQAAKGLVLYQGAWLTVAERDRRIVIAAAERAARLEREAEARAAAREREAEREARALELSAAQHEAEARERAARAEAAAREAEAAAARARAREQAVAAAACGPVYVNGRPYIPRVGQPYVVPQARQAWQARQARQPQQNRLVLGFTGYRHAVGRSRTVYCPPRPVVVVTQPRGWNQNHRRR